MARLLPTATLLALLGSFAIGAEDTDRLKVGVQPDGRIVVPTNQVLRPAGTQVSFPGRPVDLLLIDDGKTLVVKNRMDLVFVDAATGTIRQTLRSPGQGKAQVGFSVVGLARAGNRVYASDAKQRVHVAKPQTDGKYGWDGVIALPAPEVRGEPNPAGLAVVGDHLAVAATRANAIHFVNLASGKVEQTVAVGVAPYLVLQVGADRLYVSNWGGDWPTADDRTATSSGTPARVDERGIANHGSVSVLRKSADGWKQAKSITVGLHPSGMTASKEGRYVYVANAASDSVSVIDTKSETVVETIACRPEARLPFGSGSNAVALSPDGGTLYVANGTNNCVAVVRLGKVVKEDSSGPDKSELLGMIPVGWYPGALCLSADGRRLVVANVKGHGALDATRSLKSKGGYNSHDHLGTVSLVDLSDLAALENYTAEVNENNRLAYSLAGLEKPRPDAAPLPIPARHGEPSVIEHVVYVIKENRTYDQVFGDIKEGNGDPKLCIFGQEVTPNHHKLACEFTLLDNFYCSGVLSADGHQWVNEAYVTDYLEKSFGGFTRSYPYEGNDPLAFAPSGFLWDNALSRKRTLRNYGEFTKTRYAPKTPTWSEMYGDFKAGGGKFRTTAMPQVAKLAAYTHATYPGFQLNVPDQYRRKLFVEELADYEKKGSFPNLVYLYLPCNHTSGTRPNTPTPRSMVADNDLALGQCVEALTKTKFWPKMAILVVEDDPQAGFDHVDGHRTVALAISPFIKRKSVDSTCYNQTGMVKTIELILGLPPMNQLDLSATAMRACFQSTPDVTPYAAVPNRIPLDTMNPSMAALRGPALEWAKKSLEMNLDEADEADEDTLNRILWFSVRGEERYPGDQP
jgi:YVTN family beta-propeller protein